MGRTLFLDCIRTSTRYTSEWGLFILLICLTGESKPYTEDKGMEAPLSFYALQELLTALIEPKVQTVTFMIWNCGNCGAEIDEGTQFCPKCGTKINWETPQTDQTFTCGNCGGEFKGRVEYCPHCGTNINWESTNNNQNETSERYNLYGMAFVAICAFIAMGIYIYRGDDWFFIIFMTVAAILVGLGFIGYAEEQNIPKNIALPITCFIGFVVLALAINKLNDYWDLQKEIEQRAQETEQKAREQKEEAEREYWSKPIRGSKDVDFVKKRIAKGSIWTYTQNYGNPIGWWFRLKFDKTNCEVYDALPADGEWKFRYKTPYYVEEKRLDDGKRYVFVCLRYSKDDYGNMREDMYPMKINITQGSFIYGASGAIGFINEKDYEWD